MTFPVSSAAVPRIGARAYLPVSLLLILLFLAFGNTKAHAVSNLTVTPNDSQALSVQDYTVSFTAGRNLTYSDYIEVEWPEAFTIDISSGLKIVDIRGSSWGGSTFTMDGHTLKVQLPTSVQEGDTVSIPVGSSNNVRVITPWKTGTSGDTGTYTVAVDDGSGSTQSANVTIRNGAEIQSATLMTVPAFLEPHSTNDWTIMFDTSRALLAGDLLHLQLPVDAIQGFNLLNQVSGTSTPAFTLNGTDPDWAKGYIDGGITIPVPVDASSNHNTLVIHSDAITNPGYGSYQLRLSTTSDNKPHDMAFNIVNRLQITATSNKQNEPNVEYTLNYSLRSDVSADNRLVLKLPAIFTTLYDVVLDHTNVRLSNGSTEIPFTLTQDADAYIRPSDGSTLTAGTTVTLKVRVSQNPVEVVPLLFGMTTDDDESISGVDYEVFSLTPVYLTNLYHQSIRLQGDPYLKIQSAANNSFTGSSPFTIGMWIKPDATEGNQVLYRKASGGTGQLETTLFLAGSKLVGGLGIATASGVDWNYLSSDADIPAHEWTHVALVQQSGRFQLYVNGKESASFPADSLGEYQSASASSGNVYIGDDPQASAPFFGNIDDLQIWDIALSEDDWWGYYSTGIASIFDGSSDYYPAARYTLNSGSTANSGSDTSGGFMSPDGSGSSALYLTYKNQDKTGIFPSLGMPGTPAYHVMQQGSNGLITSMNPSTGQFTYRPSTDFTGSDVLRFGVEGADDAITLATITIDVLDTTGYDPAPYGSNVSNPDLANLTINGENVTLTPGVTVLHWAIMDTYRANIHASGSYGQYVTINGETITAAGGKSLDLSDGDNTVTIQVDSYDLTQTKTYTLNIYVVSDAEKADIASRLQAITADQFLNGNASESQIKTNLHLATAAVPDGYSFQWVSSNPDLLLDYGYVLRANLTVDTGVTLKAVISRDHVSFTKEFTLTILHNTKPVANPQAVTKANAGSMTGYLTGSDPDGDAITYYLDSYTMGSVSINASTGEFYYSMNNPGTEPLIDKFYFYTMDSSGARSDTATVTVTIEGSSVPNLLAGLKVGTSADALLNVIPNTDGTFSATVTGATYAYVLPAAIFPSFKMSVNDAVYTDAAIQVPLAASGPTSVTIKIWNPEQTSFYRTYTLTINKDTGTVSKPVLLSAVLLPNGTDLVLRFNSSLTVWDGSKLSLTAGGIPLSIASTDLSGSDLKKVTVKLASPVAAGKALSIHLEAGAATNGSSDNEAASLEGLNFSSAGTGGSTAPLNVGNLFTLSGLSSLPPEVIKQILNSLPPRFVPQP